VSGRLKFSITLGLGSLRVVAAIEGAISELEKSNARHRGKQKRDLLLLNKVARGEVRHKTLFPCDNF